jgi:hypothetical protein
MQTFLPYSNFEQSAACLDNKRLGCQRKEAYQILLALSDSNYGWQNHPCVRQWKGYEDALTAYYGVVCREWINRGFKHTMPVLIAKHDYIKPPWLGNDSYHLSHQSNLLRKDFNHYSKYWLVSDNLPYYWPV